MISLKRNVLNGRNMSYFAKYRVVLTIIFMCIYFLVVGVTEDFANTRKAEWSMKSKVLAGITRGMSESDVIKLLGPPDEVRTPQKPIPVGVSLAFVWAYGVEGAQGTFARVGLVRFGKDRKVFDVAAPIFPDFLRKGATNVPLSEAAIRTASGVYCYLEPVEYDRNDKLLKANVSVINTGTEVFTLKHDNTGIGRGGVLEIYDRKKNLMVREDKMSYHSPYALRPDHWPVMTIRPGEKKTEEIRIGAPILEKYGKLLPGVYYVRYLCPLEQEEHFVTYKRDGETISKLADFDDLSDSSAVRLRLMKPKFFSSNLVKFYFGLEMLQR